MNVLSAVASRGARWFTVLTCGFTAEDPTGFLDRLAGQADSARPN